MARQQRGAGGDRGRRFFDKVLKDPDATFKAAEDGPRFFEAMLKFDDEMELLFRLTSRKEHGARRLRASVAALCGTPGFVANKLVPFLAKLGSDALCSGTCTEPLAQLLGDIYSVPGLSASLLTTLSGCSATPGDAATVSALGWFALNVATKVEGAKADPEIRQFASVLEGFPGAGAMAAKELKLLLSTQQQQAASAAGGAAGGHGTVAGGKGTDDMVALEDLQAHAGGRHDNDAPDYRDISIMVTSNEALCSRLPYLPRPDDESLLPPETALLDRHFRLLREDMVAPLREELAGLGITALKRAGAGASQQADGATAVQDAGSSSSGATAPRGLPALPHPTASSAAKGRGAASALPKWLQGSSKAPTAQQMRNVYQRVQVLGVCLRPRPCVMVSLELPSGHSAQRHRSRREREDYWKNYGHGTLPMDALVCLVTAAAEEPLLFATVGRREPQEMAGERPMVGLCFEASGGVEAALQGIGQQQQQAGQEFTLVQVSTQLLSIRPVLRCLQGMLSVPLGDELVKVEAPKPVGYLSSDVVAEELGKLGDNWDASQVAAVKAALTQRVALIQGPPGTGKTYTGVQLCEIILRRTKEAILVVCYTNHALDQFLGALLDRGISQIVRLGGRCRDERLEPYTIRQLERNTQRRSAASRPQERLGYEIRTELRQLEEQVAHLGRLLSVVQPWGLQVDKDGQAAAGDNQWEKRQEWLKRRAQQRGGGGANDKKEDEEERRKLQTVDDWDDMEEYLRDELPGVYAQLQVPPDAKLPNWYLWRNWVRGFDKGHLEQASAEDLEASADGQGTFQQVKAPPKKKKKQAHDSPTAPAADAAGPSSGSTSGVAEEAAGSGNRPPAADPLQDIWALSKWERKRYSTEWRQVLRQEWAEQLAKTLQTVRKLQQQQRALDQACWEQLIGGARVVGCTTTGAALYKELLQGPQAPRVVLVEEAAEILEAHVLSSLSPRTKHLVMIGDHKQLRPKVECYHLSVQANKGHQLNVSLFERLVLAGYPHATLAVQHRMHPTISALIRPTYPALDNHPKVAARPAVKGLASRLVFIDHQHPELQEEKASRAKWTAGLLGTESQSKANTFEVGMTVAVVRYLLQQGYRAEQLVVLTPYLGQLQEIQHEFSRQRLKVELEDADVKDLSDRGMLPEDEEQQAVAAATGGPGKGGAEANGKLPAGMSRATASAVQKLLAGATSSTSASGETKPKSSVRVATIDNYQGEEADVVVASLVRSNSKGAVGFLREPERINVLLSRARHGMVLIGNAATLRSASHPEARKHWGRVLDCLEAGGHLLPYLPAVCQQHGQPILPRLDNAQAFLLHSPDGGCCLPCSAVLPCGHRCPLRCHAFDPEHKTIRCPEAVFSTCSEGHMVLRQCWEHSAPCTTCVEIARVQDLMKRNLERLERQAAHVRAQADKQRAMDEAELQQLSRKLAAMEEQRAARQAAVLAGIQKKKLQQQVELQERLAAREMAEWEAEALKRAEAEMAEAEMAAKLAELQREEQEAAKQMAAMQRQVRTAEKRAAAQEQAANQALQALENQKRRAAVQAEDVARSADLKAKGTEGELMSGFRWKQALGKLVQAGDSELPGFRDLLRQSATLSSNAGGGSSSLDLVFRTPGLAALLYSYARSDLGAAAAPAEPTWLQRGMLLLKDAKWLDAMEFFRARQQAEQQAAAAQAQTEATAAGEQAPSTSKAPAGSTSVQLLDACILLCSAKLGVADTSRMAQAPQNSLSSAFTSTAAGHPLQHLALAVAAPVPAAVAGRKGKAEDRTLVGRLQQQDADTRAAGQAVAYLLHPAAGQLPSRLADEAWEVLRVRGKVLLNALVTAAGSSGGRAALDGGGSWEEQLKKRAKGSKALGKLFDLVGMREVKEQLLDLKDQVALDKERGRDVTKLNFSVQFYGNPGTGKTVVARIYAEVLVELGVLPKAEVHESSGAALVNEGVSGVKKVLDEKLGKGGVLFIDEAYQMNPASNPMGGQVLDYLLPEIENRRGKLVVVLAGYQRQMEDLMGYNDGLPSRFPHVFKFRDYSDSELTAIMSGMLQQSKPTFMVQDPKHLRIAARRLGRQRGRTGFGNARAVRNLIEQAIKRQSARVLLQRKQGLHPDPLLLVREDLLGPREVKVEACPPLQQLQAMRGLKRVKQSVATLLQLLKTNAELEEQEQPLKDVCLNRVFLGNPGTGKTTVANIYGAVLKELGLLSKGEVVVKVPADFIGSVLGESEKKTAAILEATAGCVLVIDEAYGLYSEKSNDPYREAVVDTIVARVQGVPGDDRCVLLLGYKEQMETMMRKANPGLARRFQLQDAWYFDDYNDEDLLAIMREAARTRYGWQLGYEQLRAGVKVLARERRKPNFGNAGAVNNLLAQAAQRMEARLTAEGLDAAQRAAAIPQPEDFGEEKGSGKQGKSDSSAIFGDLIGCKPVLAKLREWQATIRAAQSLGRDPLDSFELNFLFVGPPGTGKTTVARRLGMLFEDLGLLAESDVVACSASDFVTGYANQASGKTREIFDSALGKVLFIDEAYRLNPKIGGPYMSEVLDEIVQLLTEPKYQGKMVVILAGYEAEVDALMKVNPGLRSRFSEKLHFAAFTAADACQLLQLRLKADSGLALDAAALDALPLLAQQLVEAPNWSSGRDVGTWAKRIFRTYAMRRNAQQAAAGAAAMEEDQAITPADLELSLQDFLATKTSVAAPRAPDGGDGPATSSTAAAPSGSDSPTAGSGAGQLQPTDGSTTSSPALVTDRENLWRGIMMPPQHATSFAQAPPQKAPAAAVTVATAAPAVALSQPELAEWEVVEEPMQQQPATAGASFGGLSPEFLAAVQTGLEELGFDLTSADAMQQAAGDSGLPESLLPALQNAARAMGIKDPAVLREMVRQWQEALQRQLEQERELAKKRQRPVWRCAVCGRYGCPVAPYIERYEEF